MTTGDADAEIVVPLDGLSRASLPLTGGKAANLGEMTGAALPVPKGFCVTTRAYALVAAGSSIAPLHAELAGVPAGDRARLDALAGRARDAMLCAPVPDSIRRACASAYRTLGERAPVAVRSSATAEDLPDASFAGQQDTYLNVVGEDAVQDAIRRCWASLWTDRAVAYRASHGIDHREVKLAVVVQAMVKASVAGVLFTANPVTGKRRQAVIDASPGLGEAVVSGAVNPDHFEVDATTGEVLVRRLGDKRLAIESVEGGGTRRVERADADMEPCVSDDEIAQLVRLGKRVEAHYGAPQDLEWAFDATRTLFLLQARPITTLFPLPKGAPADDRDLRVYFDFNVAQGVFRPLTPMGIACWRFFTSGIAKRAGLAAWDPHVGAPFLVEAAGRLFVDVTAAVRNTVGRKAMGFALSRMEARSAAAIGPLLEDPRLSLVPFSRARLAWAVVSALLRTRAPFVALRALRSPPSALALCARSSEEALAVADVDADATPEQRLEAAERALHAVPRVFLVHVPTVIAGMLGFVIAKRLLGGLSTEVEHDVVFRALPHNPTTEMDLALFGLAQEIRSDAALRRLVRETPPEELSRRFRERTLPQALQGGLEQFLERYGARGVAEIDVGVARWAEDPAHLLGSLANYLALDSGAFAPDAQFEKALREAEAMREELCRRARAKGLVRGALVRFFLGRMRSLAGIREAPKFQLVRILARVRTLLLSIGESLVSAQRLDAPEGIFFLTFPEVHRALGGSDLRGAVRERTAVYEREIGRKHLPRFLLSDGTEPASPAGVTTGALSGTPASAGTITALARVILDPNGARLEPGEILVAPSTDPGWTPLFLTAGGLVMEMGGAMSHGAVVAREYGIPAVVGVAHATERIRTGQRIRVDGATGTIDLAVAVLMDGHGQRESNGA